MNDRRKYIQALIFEMKWDQVKIYDEFINTPYNSSERAIINTGRLMRSTTEHVMEGLR